MTRTEAFEYLDDLRESGITNMYGAAAFLEDECGLDKKTAKKFTLEWIHTFSRDKTAVERAASLEK